MSFFGELVKQHRERSGWSKETFASELRISTGTLWQIENKGHVPNARILARMVTRLHLTPFQANALLKAVEKDANRGVDGNA